MRTEKEIRDRLNLVLTSLEDTKKKYCRELFEKIGSEYFHNLYEELDRLEVVEAVLKWVLGE